MSEPTDYDLEELKRMEPLATSGEWIATKSTTGSGYGVISSNAGVAHFFSSPDVCPGDPDEAKANAELTAAIRNALPALLAVMERLPKTNDGVRVLPGDTVYQIDPRGMINSPPGMAGPDPNPRPWRASYGGGGPLLVPDMPIYSTEEAAIQSLDGASE